MESLQQQVFEAAKKPVKQSLPTPDADKAVGALGIALSKIKHIDLKTRKQLATRINDALKYLNSKPETGNALSNYLGTNPKNYRAKN